MYKRLYNPSEEEVSKLLKEGYCLHSVTKIRAIYTELHSHYDLVYHLIKEVQFPKWNLGVDLSQSCNVPKSQNNLS